MESKYPGSGAAASFLRELLKKRKMSRDEFSVALDMEPELTDAILDGLLPASEFGKELIDEIAELLDCSPYQITRLLHHNDEP